MSTKVRISKLFATTVTALVAIAAGACLALAAPEQTRESYVAQVEPICKTNTKANERILAGAEKKVKNGELKVAAGQFARASAAFAKAVKQIRAVPPPPADKAKLAKWIGYLGDEQKLLGEIGKALKAGKKGQAQNLRVRLDRNQNLANNAVLGFEFDYCLIDSNRFS
jgi:Zn-dependent M28 family amino/carboxypeptidase